MRLTAWAVLVSALLGCAIYVSLMALHRDRYVDRTWAELAKSGRLVIREIGQNRLNPQTASEGLVQVVDGRGVIVSSSSAMVGYPPVDFAPPGRDDPRRDGRSCRVQAPGGRCFLIIVSRIGEGPDQRLVYTLAPEPALIPDVRYALLLVIPLPLVAGLAGYGTWRGTGRVLRPVMAIRAELDEITATDLERRVPVPARNDEIRRLAESVNATLDRLERSVARLRGFVSDISHELRSPLTGLRMELELALSEPNGTDLRENLHAVLENAERLQAVLDDLLALARIEANPKLSGKEVDLQELADQSVLARPRRARFTVLGGEPVVVRGGPAELERLLNNLLDNADRHASSSVTVDVRAETAGDGKTRTAVVEIYDDGPGISPEDRERVFERFTRLSEVRHRDAGGTGLGLAISREIAQAHGGTLDLTDRQDGRSGARVVLRLPAV